MSHPAPRVYIDDQLMDSYAYQDKPVLAGLKITYGVDTDLDMQGPEHLSLQLLIREASDLSFIELGKEIAVYNPPSPGFSTFTYFVGRIARPTANPHPSLKGALLVNIEAVDFTADLANETAYNVVSAEAPASTRILNMAYWAPEGWGINTFPLRFPNRRHAALSYKEKPFLELFDQFLRGQIMQRTNRSFYTPGSGVTKRLTAIQDSTKDVAADTLTVDADGTWNATAGIPEAAGYVAVRVPASNILRDVGWTKEPEDVITEVSVQRIDAYVAGQDSTKTPVSSRTHIDTAASRRAYGVRSVEINTDLIAGAPAAEVLPVFNHWLATDSQWRTKQVTFRDTAELTITQLSWLVAPTSRNTAFLVIRDPLENRPDNANADIRGVVIGGEATWTGKKWDLTVTLGRVPGMPSDGDYWTFAGLAADAVLKAGTAETVGNQLSFNDFLRIGQPA